MVLSISKSCEVEFRFGSFERSATNRAAWTLATVEVALLERIDVVDAQVHLFHGLTIEGCMAAMDALGIQGVLVDEMWELSDALDGKTATREVSSPIIHLANGVKRPVTPGSQFACMKHPGRFKYQVRLDYRDPQFKAIMSMASQDPHCAAVRCDARFGYEQGALANGEYREIFGSAASLGLPISVQTGGTSSLLESSLSEFTSCRFIIDHIGHPKGPEGWDEVLRLSRYDNVYLKWSHAARVFPGPYPFREAQIQLKRALDNFGRERIMWASDCTMLRPSDSWANTLFYVRDCHLLSTEDRQWILAGTARKVFDWPPSI